MEGSNWGADYMETFRVQTWTANRGGVSLRMQPDRMQFPLQIPMQIREPVELGPITVDSADVP
jgi:hypothetical protein